jgi:hypothetical protein
MTMLIANTYAGLTMWIRLADQDVVSKKILHICRNRQNQPLIKGTLFHFMYAIKYIVRAKHVDCNSNTDDGHVICVILQGARLTVVRHAKGVTATTVGGGAGSGARTACRTCPLYQRALQWYVQLLGSANSAFHLFPAGC